MQKEIIQKIVAASGITADELVLVHFWGEDADIEIMHHFADAVASLGASPVEMQQSRTVNAKRFTELVGTTFNDKYFERLSNFDAVLDIFCYQPVVLGTKLDDEKMMLYKNYMGRLFGAVSKAKRMTQIRIPSSENASEANMSHDEFAKRMYSAYDVDYNALKAVCEAKISEMKSKGELALLTGTNCRLDFDLTGRKWYIDAGDGDMPCGEVYIAPIEAKTNGTVFFKTLYAGDWGNFENVTLTIKGGVVVNADNALLDGHFEKLDAKSKTICELGFGLNPSITSLCGYTVLDEKACGTFHIAIGANTMFGGTNDAQLHMDFVGHYNKVM
ncbi:MAG: aminopeptidase [Defluviitaleaceae bacterium]|nr:aminopeptidase [Defluviitaleaceae bacterium]